MAIGDNDEFIHKRFSMKKFTLLPLAMCVFASVLSAQTPNFFQAIPEGNVELRGDVMKRDLFPSKYQTYRLDYQAMVSALVMAPMEFTAEARMNKCRITIPLADGSMETFSVYKTAMMEPELAALYPEIGTYAGRSMRDATITVRIMHSGRGFRAMVMKPDLGVDYVKPYAYGQDEFYIAYDRADMPADSRLKNADGLAWDGTVAQIKNEDLYAPPAEERGTLLNPINLKVFRFIAACTGEFAQDHGGTKPLALAAVMDYTDQISGVMERDLDLRLQLATATQNVIFLDPTSDPYTGTSVLNWATENVATLNFYCNPNSHDIGHVYSRYMGGPGGVSNGLGIVCGNGKAGGCSAGNGNGDYGDGFVGIIGQEVGHQLNSGHSWNSCDGGSGRNGQSAFEPGSGSTIMSYAGGCNSDNVQSYSDLYYHSGSAEEIIKFYTIGTGTTCGSTTPTDNNPPVVTLPYQDNFFIPIQTPFELNGSATDPDGDPLVYVWEGIDAGPETPLGTQISSSAIFRTYPSGTATNRYFPRLSTILSNSTYNAEILPEYTRDVTLRLVARDQKPNGGGIAWADVAFKAWGDAGPFLVNFPNANTDVLHIGEYAEIVWDVANTNIAPVNCQKVNIRLSTDGGQTYPITLASGVANDGSHYVLVPNNPTSSARVRVDAADNVFFDISNANFKIQQPTAPSLTLGLSADAATICLPDNFESQVQTAGTLGFNSPVTLALTGTLPPGAVATLSATTINPGESSTLSVDLSGVTQEGIYTFNLEATAAGSPTLVRPITMQLFTNDFSGFTLDLPVDGSTGLDLTQTLRWTTVPDGLTYDVQFSKSPSFSSILASKTDVAIDSLKIPFLLEKGTAYYWRVRTRNECGIHEWSEPSFFSTYYEKCQVFTANDLPKNLTANGTPTVESKITVNAGGVVSDFTIKQIKGYHSFFKDLTATLTSPLGTEVTLFDEKCGNYNGFFNFGLSDDAPGGFPCPPANNGQVYRAENPLDVFIGQDNTGPWTLRIKDNVLGSGGSLEIFKLEFCGSVVIEPPFLVNNNPLTIPTGSNQLITPDLLLCEDANNTHDQLVYTLLTVPVNGLLDHAGFGTMHPGDNFTQAELDAGAIRFFDYGNSAAPDGFRFTVTDGEGGFLGTPKFIILPLGVGTDEPASDKSLPFNLFPNPATDAVWITLDQPSGSRTLISLYSATGQLVRTDILAAGTTGIQLELGSLPKGMYAVRMENETGTGAKKLILR